MDIRKSADLADDLAARALAAVHRGDVSHPAAVAALFTGCATLIALLPESEWDDAVNKLSAAMPDVVRRRAAQLQDAGIIASRGARG